MHSTRDLNVLEVVPLVPPREFIEGMPITEEVSKLVTASRQTIVDIVAGKDPRLIAVVGPCSIHDERAAVEYAERLAALSRRVADRIFVIMRVYFEKPRTALGWKGLINDPFLDDSFNVQEGLRIARRILLTIGKMGLPTGTEMLEPVTPQYISDLVSWASIGARTTESPTHRQMASGLSMPVGYKNSTDGSIDVAINAMKAAASPHSFLGIDTEGRTCVVKTRGNAHGHIILRGGHGGPNYDAETVGSVATQLQSFGLPPRMLIDCSHANSDKDHTRQRIVWENVVEQRAGGQGAIAGAMIESNLQPGKQGHATSLDQLKYGVSITDACIGWEETEELLLWAHSQLGRVPANA